MTTNPIALDNRSFSSTEKIEDLVTDESSEQEEYDDDDDYDIFDDLQTRCECKVELAKGWQCDNCRVNCPECNRALTKDLNDYCTRCNEKCQRHGLFKLCAHKSCPHC